MSFFFEQSTSVRNIETYCFNRYGNVFRVNEANVGAAFEHQQYFNTRYGRFANDLLIQDIDDMNDLHYTIFDNDPLKVRALEGETLIGYYATLSSVIRVADKKAKQQKPKA